VSGIGDLDDLEIVEPRGCLQRDAFGFDFSILLRNKGTGGFPNLCESMYLILPKKRMKPNNRCKVPATFIRHLGY
jgi:hypothetical protein